MPLPAFDSRGYLPEGIHQAALDEVITRFGHNSLQRERVTSRLERLYDLATATGKLLRFVIFGSYVTAKPEPNDIDIILVMADDFTEQDYDPDSFPMFEHLRVQQELGASLFVIRPGFIIGETVDNFLTYWQITRDKSRHGLVEVIPEVTP